MKKLIFIAIVAISLISVSNALGQEKRTSSKTKIVKRTPWVIAADHGLSVKTGKSRGSTSNQRSSRTRKPAPNSLDASTPLLQQPITIQSPKPSTSRTRKAKKPTQFRPNPAGDGTTEQFRTRKRSTQKRQYKPLSF